MRIIAGRWGGRTIRAPRGRGTRPTGDRVREAWMASLGPRLPGADVLDLFAGSGALGLETLSRGAATVVFVERGAAALRVLRENVESLGAGDAVKLVRRDALAYARDLDAAAFDVAVADPPYGEGLAAALLEIWEATPFASELWVEHRSSDPVPEPAGSERRRYGDTTLTRVHVDP